MLIVDGYADTHVCIPAKQGRRKRAPVRQGMYLILSGLLAGKTSSRAWRLTSVLSGPAKLLKPPKRMRGDSVLRIWGRAISHCCRLRAPSCILWETRVFLFAPGSLVAKGTRLLRQCAYVLRATNPRMHLQQSYS